MTKTPEQVMAQMYKGILVIMIVLLTCAGIASFLNWNVRGLNLAETLVKFYLLTIPATLMAFTIVMFLRRATNLALGAMILSVLWLVFKWL
jgi:tryptophan-rich sensory protein